MMMTVLENEALPRSGKILKKHTARRVASYRCAALSPGGGIPTLAGGGGEDLLWMDGGYIGSWVPPPPP